MSLKQMRGDGREGKAGRFRKAVSSSHTQSIYCKGVQGTEKQAPGVARIREPLKIKALISQASRNTRTYKK